MIPHLASTVQLISSSSWREQYLKLERENEQLKLLVYEDALTGLYNHRSLQKRLPEEFSRARRSGESLAVLMIDLDNFGILNKKHGHPTMNQILKDVATALQQNSRASDAVFRYGGDEMALLLPNMSEIIAQQTAERLRNEVKTLKKPFSDALTLSIGIAVDTGQYGTAERLFEAADRALRKAKRLGKDQVQMAGNDTG